MIGVYKNCGPGSAIDKGAIPICFEIGNKKIRRRSKTLKGSQRICGRAKFAENLRTAPFNKDETTFSQTHVSGQSFCEKIIKFFSLRSIHP
jgi:hypothetical protein